MRNRRKKTGSCLLFGAVGTAACLFLGGCLQSESKTEVKSEAEVKSETCRALVQADYPEEPVFQEEEEQWEYYSSKRRMLPDRFIHSYEGFVTDTAAQVLTESGENGKNVIYSPLSLYYALALAAAGAEGETQEEFLQLLHYEDLDVLASDCKTSFESFYHVPREENNHPNEWGEYPQESRYALLLANSIWADDSVTLKASFFDTVKEKHYAELYQTDLQSPGAGEEMARWVKEKTNGVLAPEAAPLDDALLMSLKNTVYFYDEWMDRFDKEQTERDLFTCMDGTEVDCEFMNRKMSSHGFSRGENYTESTLSLKNGQMTFYLPDEGVSAEELMKTPEKAAELLYGDREPLCGEVIWKIPKFSYGGELSFEKTLHALGLDKAFSEEAEFSNLTDQKPLFLSSVSQDAHIGIDENGVEAAAFTEISWAGAAMPTERAEMILDRPFLYTIQVNGQVIFAGICQNPTEGE